MIEIQNSKLKGQKFRSKFKTFNFSLTILTFAFLLLTSTVFAVDSSPSADVTTKLKALQAEIASQSVKIKLEISKKLQNKVFAGFISSKSDNSLTLATKMGTRMVNINDYTEYSGKGKINDYVIALGDIDETEVLTAKRVIKTASPSAEERKAVFGQVTGTGDQMVTIRGKDGTNISVSVGSDTNYSFGKNPGSFDEIKVSEPIVVIGEMLKNNTLQARFVYIFPYTANMKPKAASPSAVSTSPAKKKSP